jgi:hypothetical protein
MIKGQFSIEFLSLLVIFLVIFIPLIILLLSQDKSRQESLMNEQEYNSMLKLKNEIENVFASCPTVINTSIYLPRKVNINITNKTDNLNRAVIIVSNIEDRGSNYIKETNVIGGNLRVNTIDNISGGPGFITITLSCNITNDNINITANLAK